MTTTATTTTTTVTHLMDDDLLPACGSDQADPTGWVRVTPVRPHVDCPACAPHVAADAARAIEQAAAAATVTAWGMDAVWTAPTATGATLRASLCLTLGADAADVADALGRWYA